MDENVKKAWNFLNTKKGMMLVSIIFLLIITSWATSIRLQNLDHLEDHTTGKKIPLALDPYYFLRVAETKVSPEGGEGNLPEHDKMRYPSAKVDWHPEILPNAVIFLHNSAKIFNPDISLRYVDVISPVVFFFIGLILFFFLCYALTNSLLVASISSVLLGFIPSFLYRTMAGFSDHESIGMMSFFAVLLGFVYSMKYLDKLKNKTKDKKDYYRISLFALVTGFLTALTIASWGGVANYVFMILPLSFLIFWIINANKKNKDKINEKYFLYYILWLVFTVISGFIFGYNPSDIINKYVLGSQGLITLIAPGFIIIDYFMIWIYNHKKDKLPKFMGENEKYRVLFSLIIIGILGIIGLQILRGNFIITVMDILNKLLRPAGTGRLGQTVAENRAPFLKDWIKQTGKMFFWVFFAGLFILGTRIAKTIRKKPDRTLFAVAWLILISGILFSRISQDSLFNGNNFISFVAYFGSIVIFTLIAGYIYFNDNFKIKSELIFIGSWMIFMLISGRATIRVFFLMTPFFCFMGGYTIKELYNSWKTNKDEIIKMTLAVGAIVAIVLLIISAYGFIQTSKMQAQNTGPSAGYQWQSTMSWVRDNTPEDSIFVHWWDYGYWTQYLGERTSLTDGGHKVGYWDHLTGRYLLTTPKPETALSFMKTHNVSHLLIDPSDLGKYPAYSSIGSGEKMEDRKSQIPVMSIVPSQTRETNNKTIRLYQGGSPVDKDIIFEKEGKRIFLPKDKAFIGGVSFETNTNNGQKTLAQPEGIFIYNNQQYRIPLRYVFYKGQIYDFKSGINSIFMLVPSLEQTNQQGINVNNFGAGIYLSPLTSESAFAQLYLMDDPFNKYPTLEIAHKQDNQFLESIKSQFIGSNELGDFIIYRGFQGPIKIWNVSYPEEIITNKEFLERRVPEEGYGSLDSLKFKV